MRCRRQLARNIRYGSQKDWNTGADVLADADLQDKPLIYVDQVGTFQNLGRQLEPVMSPRWGETNSGYRVIRYPIYPTSTGLDWRNADQVEFRLAEVYYTLAECHMRSGNPSMAKSYVNQVRGRYFGASDQKELENLIPVSIHLMPTGFSASGVLNFSMKVADVAPTCAVLTNSLKDSGGSSDVLRKPTVNYPQNETVNMNGILCLSQHLW